MPYLKKNGFTLIDVLLSAVVLLTAICGSIQYRYHSALEMRRAKMYISGAELAQTLIETWRGEDGDPTFNAESYFNGSMSITADTGPAIPVDHTLLGSYAIRRNDYDYKASLSSRSMGKFKTLNVAVSWPMGNSKVDKEFRLTTYVSE